MNPHSALAAKRIPKRISGSSGAIPSLFLHAAIASSLLVAGLARNEHASAQDEGFDALEGPQAAAPTTDEPPAPTEPPPPPIPDPLSWQSDATSGRVTRIHEDLVLVEMPPGIVPARGQHVVFGTGDGTGRFGPISDDQVVGEVAFLRPDGAVVQIGPGQQVAVGDTAQVTERELTSTVVAPTAPDHLIRLELLGGTTLRTAGVVGEARLTVHHRSAFFFAELQPSAYVAARVVDGFRFEPSMAVAGSVGAGYQQRFVAAGMGLGVLQARRSTSDGIVAGVVRTFGGPEPTLVAHLRVGALDGISFVTDLALSLGSPHYGAAYRMNLGLYAPCSAKVLLGLRGGTWFTAQSYSDLHVLMRIRVHGNGGAESWYVRGALSFYWLHDVIDPSAGAYYSNVQGALYGAQLGLEHRFGLGGRSPTMTR